MRSRTDSGFECKVRYEKTTEDGTQKKVTETYVVDALSFSEAESRMIEGMSHFVSGELEVTFLKIAQYKEIFFDNDHVADKWYKAKLAFITIDEKTDKQKKTTIYNLVNASNINAAIVKIDEIMANTMIDYLTCNVSETNIMDVFEYKPKGDNNN